MAIFCITKNFVYDDSNFTRVYIASYQRILQLG